MGRGAVLAHRTVVLLELEARDLVAVDLVRTVGDAQRLPVPSGSVDVFTIAFGLRNVTDIASVLSEARRVLKPGGKFLCLEFSHVEPPILSKAYDLYSFNVIPKVGKAVTNDEESYQYLVESIRKFPTARKLEARMQDAGFTKTNPTQMNAGIVAIHQGLKA